ncbi:syntaxin-4 isoform X1 [Aedes aegypti]|uniref:Uncharacterized protein n=1 Tax=Aedes aegypti TaxID=7159 RepID=A0A6I8THV1_AEDAE|nr:syntaxin-4 isoform X1 [Aedes aegypti]
MRYNITDDEAAQMLTSDQMVPFVILEGAEGEQQILRDIRTQYSKVIELEKSLIEYRHCMQRLSMHVMKQGSLVQRIEHHAQKAPLNIDQGVHQLERAQEYNHSLSASWFVLVLGIFVLLKLVF